MLSMECGMVSASLRCSNEECEVMSDKWEAKNDVKKRESLKEEGRRKREEGRK